MTELEQKFLKALDKWGLRTQMLILVEECNELAVAGLHFLRDKEKDYAEDHLAEEIADVELMTEQIKYALNLERAVKNYREAKINRLDRFLKE